MRRRLLPAAFAAAGCLVVAGCGSSSIKITRADEFGPFAGYVWNGEVRQISADIRVPRLIGAAHGGAAATWIGVRGAISDRTQSAPFFQIGVNEDWTHAGQVGGRDYAFWSSTGRDFAPQVLFSVRPGDVLAVSIAAAGRRLRMTVTDRRSGWHRTVGARLGREEDFDTASWHQEDVTDVATGEPFPYPQMGAARFSAMRVDGVAPRPRGLDLSWMSTSDAFYGPSPVRGGGFTIAEIHPSRAALEYERLAVPYDLAGYVFDSQSAAWSGSTSPGTIAAACRRYVRVLDTDLHALAAYPWPQNVRSGIARLIASTRQMRSYLERLARHTTAYLDQFRATEIPSNGLAIRKALHMAVFDPSGIFVTRYEKAQSG
jgi:hypothetical protein